MKLRIRGNSLRLRLNRLEINQLADTGAVADTIRFSPSSILTYRIEAIENTLPPIASFDHSMMTIRVSKADIKTWTNSESVGIYGQQTIDEKNILKITLEKDFACLENRSSEDDSESFPNPKSTARP